MKNLLAFLVICLAAYGGYSFWKQRQAPPALPAVSREPAPAEPPAVKAPPPVMAEVRPAPTPKPAAPTPPEPPTPVPPVKRLAPEGVYFVLYPVSVTRDEGITRIREGTQVKLLKEAGETVHVTDGRIEFDVQKGYLTNDLDVIARLRGQQLAQQAQVSTLTATEIEKQKQEQAAKRERQAQEAAASMKEGQRNIALQQLRARLSQLEAAERKLDQEVADVAFRSGSATRDKAMYELGMKQSRVREQKVQIMDEIDRLRNQ